MRRRGLLSSPIAICVVVALAAALGGRSQHAATAVPAVPHGCRVRGALPDRRCTPGAVDPAVSQNNIARTICIARYAASVRPPAAYSEPLKKALISAYGAYAGRSPGAYEADHLIPLELGGAPRSVANIWPERHAGALGSYVKDREEDLLHAEVCSHRVALASAQREMADDWVAAYRRERPGR